MQNWNKDFNRLGILAIFAIFYLVFPNILIGFLLCSIALFLIYCNLSDT